MCGKSVVEKKNWKRIYYYIWPFVLVIRTGVIWLAGIVLIIYLMDLLGTSTPFWAFVILIVLVIIFSMIAHLVSAYKTHNEIKALPKNEQPWIYRQVHSIIHDE